MPYINNDGDSRLNNFPTEPKMYIAETDSSESKRNYVMIGVVATVLVGGLILVAMAVS